MSDPDIEILKLSWIKNIFYRRIVSDADDDDHIS